MSVITGEESNTLFRFILKMPRQFLERAEKCRLVSNAQYHLDASSEFIEVAVKSWLLCRSQHRFHCLVLQVLFERHAQGGGFIRGPPTGDECLKLPKKLSGERDGDRCHGRRDV